MFKINFRNIKLYLKYRYNELDRDTNFENLEIEAYEYAIENTAKMESSKSYLKEIKSKAKQYLKNKGFKL